MPPVLAPGRPRRWLAVVAGTAVLLGAPALARSGPLQPGTGPRGPQELLERAAASSDVPHSGLAVSRGGLGLPDLPQLAPATQLLGSTTRTRVWWRSAQRWRADALTTAGERDAYATGGRLTTWDYEQAETTTGPEPTGARLPRPDDLLPPPLVRRLLSGSAGRALARDAAALGSRTVAGRPADGVRLVADDARSTLARADVWLDRATGLPLAVALVDRAGAPVLDAAFDTLRVGPPDDAALVPPDAPGADRLPLRRDLVELADASSGERPPATLAGLPAVLPEGGTARSAGGAGAGGAGAGGDAGAGGAVQAYGQGLTRVVLVPLPAQVTGSGLQAARAAGAEDLLGPDAAATGHGEAVLLRSGAASVALVRSRTGRAHLLAGAVQPAVMRAAAEQLLGDPQRRWRP